MLLPPAVEKDHDKVLLVQDQTTLRSEEERVCRTLSRLQVLERIESASACTWAVFVSVMYPVVYGHEAELVLVRVYKVSWERASRFVQQYHDTDAMPEGRS